MDTQTVIMKLEKSGMKEYTEYSVVRTQKEQLFTVRKSQKALPTKNQFAKSEVGPGNINL